MPYLGREPRQGTIQKRVITVAGGTTAVAVPYSKISVDVYLNGVLLVKDSDYTADDGSSIAFTAALAQDDVVEVHSVETFEVANALQKDGDTIAGDMLNSSTGFFQFPIGTTAQRPVSPANGYVRFNTDLGYYEGWYGFGWKSLGGGAATGGGDDEAFIMTDKIITSDYVIPSNKNALSVGPLGVNAGVNIDVPADSSWVIV